MPNTKGERTRQKILNTAKTLIGNKSYDAVTTRMIAAEAGCSQSAIAFYFTTKENLCKCVVEDIIKYHILFYQPLYDSLQEAESRGPISRVEALKFLQMYLQMQIKIAMDPRNLCAVRLSINSTAIPDGLYAPLNTCIRKYVTKPIADLLTVIHPMPLNKAIVYSQALSNSIIGFPFTGVTLKEEYLETGDIELQQHILDFCMDFIESL